MLLLLEKSHRLLSFSPCIRLKLMSTSQRFSINKKGFTLIELLVVIAIIAVLAVIGFAAFRGLTGRGNDARIRADLKAIADAYEVRRSVPGVANYGGLALAVDDFSGGILPSNPITGRVYCIRTGTAAAVANAALADVGTACTAPWAVVSTAALAASSTFFKVCAQDTAGTAVSCVGSKQ